MESVHNFYKDSLDDVLDSNINDIVASIINMNPCLLRQTMSSIQLEIFFDISLLLRLFSKATSNKNKNSSLFKKRNISPMLLPNIVLRELSNLLFRLSSNYDKLRKRKPRAALTF